MSSHRRRGRRSRSRQRQQWALWAIAALLVSGLIGSRLWLAEQTALESAVQYSQTRAIDSLPAVTPEAVLPAPSEPVLNQPELLPKRRPNQAQDEVWRSGDVTHRALPADWTTPPRYVDPDPQIISILHQAGLNPQVLRRSGGLRVRRTWQGGRSQLAVVESATQRYSGSDWRMIYAIAHREQSPDPERAARLIATNGSSVLSHWVWDRGYWFAQVLVPAKASADALISAVDHVLASADDLEQELSGSADEF